MSDFEKALKDAKELSRIAGEGEIPSSLFGNIAQITDLMDIIKSFQKAGNIEESIKAEPISTSDTPLNIRALLAMAPYMGEANRKNIIIASKLMELMHFVNSHQISENIEEMHQMDNRNMLLAARPYVETDKRDMVDLLITVMDISEILKKIERMNQNAGKL